MNFCLYTHDAWGVVPVAQFASLAEARQGFAALCQDPWYQQDGTVRGIELVEQTPQGDRQRLDWFAFR